jgi:hypothetical protein
MNFLSPVFLWGLPLVAVPVLIHFFSRKQRAPIRWGAMEFLLASATPRRRFLRLRDLLLLLLRIAIVLAIIGALAQPMLSSGWIGSTGPRDIILILDNSMSTARRIGGSTVFDREIDEADKIIGQLKATDTLRILLASPAPEWLGDAPVAGGSSSLRELAARMRQVKPNDGAAGIMEGVESALQAEPAGKDVSRYITIVTDGQAHGWRAESPGAWATIHTLAKKSRSPVIIRVIVPDGVSAPSANLAVEKITSPRPVVAVGQPVTLTASIKNTGSRASATTSLSWSTKEESLGISTVPALEAGAGTTVSLSQPFTTPGLIDVSCHLAGQDDLPPDDSARFLLEVTQSVPILLVEGEPAADPAQSDSRYFMAALGYGEEAKEPGPAASIFRPKLVSYGRLNTEELSAYQCVVLADVPRLPADLVQKLARYVNSGGGLWMALGEQTDVAAFNQVFFEQSAGLSAVPLRTPVGDADDREKFISLAPPSADHPATALLADTHRLDIDKVRIYRRHQFDADNSASLTVLLRAEGGAPVAIERDLGRGRAIVMSIPFGPEWSSLPLCHSYVVMVREWLWYLTESGLVKRNLKAGEPLQVTEPIESSVGSASLETPTGRMAQLFGQEEDGRLVFRYAKTVYPGVYRLNLADAAKGADPEEFLVARDTEESNLTPLTQEQIRALSEAGGMEFGGDPLFQPANQKIAAPPKALAMWLLMALIGLMAVEIAVAFWLAHRRRATTPGVVMEPGIHA